MFNQTNLHGVAQTHFGLPATVAGWCVRDDVCALWVRFFVCLSAGYSEVQRDQREDEALDVLNEVVEGAQPVGVLALLHVQQAADLGRLRRMSSIGHCAPHVIDSRPTTVEATGHTVAF